MSEERCSDCPPMGYPTDETRCASCDRRRAPAEPVAVEAGLVEWLLKLLNGTATAWEAATDTITLCNPKSSALTLRQAASALSSLQEQVEALTRERDVYAQGCKDTGAMVNHNRRRAEAAEAEVTRLRQRVAEQDAGAGNRHPTLDEAARAAWVLLRCNGYDLDVWTDNSWPDDAEPALRNIMASASSRTKETPNA